MPFILCRNISSVSSGHDLLSTRGSYRHEEWHSDLLGCCSEPSLCMCSRVTGYCSTITEFSFLLCSLLHAFPY